MTCQKHGRTVILPSKVYRQIEEDVVALFIQLNICCYPVDPFSIANQLGYVLMPFSEMNKSALQILSPKDADGISYFDPGRNTYVIYYSANQSEERLRFTIGHEIGHIRMGHKGESTLARQIANYYSSYLLAPSPWIWTAKCKDSADIADIFMLSDLCAKYCFTRYTNWRKLHSLNNYEQTLLSLLS